MAASDATAIPVKNQAYRVTFPIWDADGDLVTGATGLDSEVSKDGGTFADCTSEATEIATASGMYFLDLTNTEMNADTVAIIVKTSSSGAKTTPIILYPQEAGDIQVNLTYWNGTAVAAPDTAGYPKVTIKDGTGTGELDTAAGVVLARDHTGAALATPTNITAGTITTTTNLTNAPTAGDLTATMKTSVTTAATAATPVAASVTGNVGGNVTGSVGSVLGAVGSVTGAVGSVTGNVGGNVVGSVASVTAGVTVTTNNDKTGYSLSAAAIQAIWDALTAALTTANSIGKLLVDNINATISSRSSHTAADVWAVATRVLTAGTNIVLAKGTGVTGFNDLSAAQVNSEMLDVLTVDTFAEVTSAPAATSSLKDKIGWLFKLARNLRKTTSTTDSVYNDAGAVVDSTSTISDDGTTFTRGEYT